MMDRANPAARRHRAIIESAVDFAIIATDCTGRVTEWNTGAERILGWSAAAAWCRDQGYGRTDPNPAWGQATRP